MIHLFAELSSFDLGRIGTNYLSWPASIEYSSPHIHLKFTSSVTLSCYYRRQICFHHDSSAVFLFSEQLFEPFSVVVKCSLFVVSSHSQDPLQLYFRK